MTTVLNTIKKKLDIHFKAHRLMGLKAFFDYNYKTFDSKTNGKLIHIMCGRYTQLHDINKNL